MDWPGRWSHLDKLLLRTGPFAHPDFEEDPGTLALLRDTVRVLVIGAGGLGCELLKDLALMGFRNLDVIDMDTIDLSNLNRQFLFRKKDIGKPKATVAAEFINNRIAGANVIPHYCKIQDYDGNFYKQFQVIVCGLDSVIARRWINGLIVSLLDYNEDGSVDVSSVIPMVDGGTEGFKGNARVILPGLSACVECTLDLYPPQVNFPMCTIAHTPRLPEHCIEYVRVLLWPQEKPFGEKVVIDGDNPEHIKWILDKSQARAEEYGIQGITYRLTQGVVKNIIPAVASTNAVIAAACATEVFKIATCASPYMSNYMNFNDTEGIYTYTFEAEKKENCAVCSAVPQHVSFSEEATLSELIEYLKDSPIYQLRNPGITTMVEGQHKTLYMSSVKSIEEKTKPNLKKSLKELGLTDGHELSVADTTQPNNLTFKLQLTSQMES